MIAAEHVAGAGGGQAGVAGGRRSAPGPPGAATTVVGPLSSTTAPVARRARGRPRGGRRPGGRPVEALELAVVGREHGRRGRPSSTAAASAPEGGEAVAVDDDGHGRPRRATSTHLGGVVGVRAEAGADHERLEPRRGLEHGVAPSPRPAAAGPRPRRARRIVGDRRASRGGPSRPRLAARPPRARWAARSCPASRPRPARPRRHLWRVAARGRAATRPRRRPRRRAARARRTSSPMSATTTSPASDRPGSSSEAGLERREGDGARRPAAPGRAPSPGQAVDPARDVDRQHRRARRRRARGARRGSRCRRRRRSPGRPAGSRSGACDGVDDLDRTPRRRRRTAAARPSAPLLPLPGQHDDPAPVAAAEQVEGVPGHGRAGALDQHLDRLRGGRVDRRHLLGGRGPGSQAATGDGFGDRDAVWVMREAPPADAHARRPAACAPPCRRTDGAPDSASATSISRHLHAPTPDAHRLHHGLLGREAGRVALGRGRSGGRSTPARRR